MLKQELAKKKLCKVINIFSKKEEIEQPIFKYGIGQKIYYTGDQANQSGWFRIVKANTNDYGNGYNLKELNGKREFNQTWEIGIGNIYKGNCNPRMVTEQAYNKYKNDIMAQYQPKVTKTETTLKNKKCSIECNGIDKITGGDLTDTNNDPRFYNVTKRSLKKAWKALREQFTANTTMHQAEDILNTNKVRTHSYCAMD